jgi:hypothetical protein
MLNAGSPTYGPSKAALEALRAIMAKDLDGTGVIVNVLVPGEMTNTSMISDEARFDRAKLIQPEVMAQPLFWLVSDAGGKVTGDGFSLSMGTPRYRPNERPRRLGRRLRGRALRRCQSPRAALSPPRAVMSGQQRPGRPKSRIGERVRDCQWLKREKVAAKLGLPLRRARSLRRSRRWRSALRPVH